MTDSAGAGDPEDVTMAQLKLLLALAATDIVSGTLADARLPARLGTLSKSITDWNTAVENGWYMAPSLGGANAPLGSNNWFYGEVINHQGAGWCTQTLYDFASGTPIVPVWRRAQQNGTWGQWYRVREEGILATGGVEEGICGHGHPSRSSVVDSSQVLSLHHGSKIANDGRKFSEHLSRLELPGAAELHRVG